MTSISRKDFLSQVGAGAAFLLLPACLTSCNKNSTTPATSSGSTASVDFTIDVSTGTLSKNGGSLIKSGVIVARTSAGAFIAVASACTHQGTNVQYTSSSNDFVCPSHGATFDANGKVLSGPASTQLQKFNTTLTGTSLRVFS
jgi:cytochrome b6-f complex iron-sulfur subunit